MDKNKLRTFEIDLSRGVFKSEEGNDEDRKALIEAMKLLPPVTIQSQADPRTSTNTKSLRLLELLDKFFSIRKKLTQATIDAYKANINEFSDFLKNPQISKIIGSDITRFQEYLLTKNNTTRTIDNKTAVIRALFNFAIKQGYYFDTNPAQNRTLMTNREKTREQYAIFYLEEILSIYSSENLKPHKGKDLDFYWVLVLALITGCRVGELTTLRKNQIVESEGIHFVRIEKSKTDAGIREIPIPEVIYKDFKVFVDKQTTDKVFKYRERDGKGAGNAVGKKFSRYLQSLKIEREKLVFHSIRKFFNNFLKDNGISTELRCQIIGHEFEGTNNQIYSDKYPLPFVAEQITKAQHALLVKIKYFKTEF
ncbi:MULTISPECIES: phage integrase [Burkholderiaceae]|nr:MULTISPECIES: tyrosine-type recombinase/integrase [Burkholderiaceae]MCA7987444.1 site-specific integrase [Burkholderia vietnamiensis]MDN7798595.1 tyrosine-type recombinase/integrase [Burkholderia vietnamiensis]HDR9036037.1 tyrosine-type recombinase/integrase [Burkholderia vietnamiensis]